MLLHPGAALEPPGDEITADIARECANDVIKELKALDVQHRGAITLEVLDTVLSTQAHRAEDEAEGDPADAVVWDELIGRTREEATLSVTFVMFLTLACLLAAIGVVTDSTVTVVGAMVLGPEFGPLAALSVAIVQRRARPRPPGRARTARRLSRRDGASPRWRTLGGGGLGWLSLDTVQHVDEVDFIFQVGPFSFVVALLAGAAGMLSLVSSKSAALVGVFISVHHGARRRFRRRRRDRRRLGRRREIGAAARGQPGRHRRRRACSCSCCVRGGRLIAAFGPEVSRRNLHRRRRV